MLEAAMSGYVVLVEGNDEDGLGYSAYSPDVPGVISTGIDFAECVANFREALALHLEVLREDGVEIPEPTVSDAAVATVVTVAA